MRHMNVLQVRALVSTIFHVHCYHLRIYGVHQLGGHRQCPHKNHSEWCRHVLTIVLPFIPHSADMSRTDPKHPNAHETPNANRACICTNSQFPAWPMDRAYACMPTDRLHSDRHTKHVILMDTQITSALYVRASVGGDGHAAAVLEPNGFLYEII